MFDNRIFNVNGKTDDQLLMALKLVFAQSGDLTCTGWIVSRKGLILTYSNTPVGQNRTINSVGPGRRSLTAEEIFPMVKDWLRDVEISEIELNDWDEDIDQDGHNGPGWRVYCEDWGNVDQIGWAICAIKPVFLWYGK